MSTLTTDKISGLSNPDLLALPKTVQVKNLALLPGETTLTLPAGTAVPMLTATRATVGTLTGLSVGQPVFLTDTHECLVWDGSAFGPLGAIDTPITINVGLGQTIPELADAYDLVRTRRITETGSVTFQLPAGISPITKALSVNHPDAARITFQGAAAITTTLTYSVGSPVMSSVSGNNTTGYDVVFNVPSASTNFAIGDSVIVRATGRRFYPAGCYRNNNTPTSTQGWADYVPDGINGTSVFITRGNQTTSSNSVTRTFQSKYPSTNSFELDSAVGFGAAEFNSTATAGIKMYYLKGFNTPLSGNMRCNLNSSSVTGDGTCAFTTELNVGDVVCFGNMVTQVASITNNNQFEMAIPANFTSAYYQGISMVPTAMLNGTWRVKATSSSTLTLAYMTRIHTTDTANWRAPLSPGLVVQDTMPGIAALGNMSIPINSIASVTLTKIPSQVDTTGVTNLSGGVNVPIQSTSGLNLTNLSFVDCGAQAFASRWSRALISGGRSKLNTVALSGIGLRVADDATVYQYGHVAISNYVATNLTPALEVVNNSSWLNNKSTNQTLMLAISAAVGGGLYVTGSSHMDMSQCTVSVSSVQSPLASTSRHDADSVNVSQGSVLIAQGDLNGGTPFDGEIGLNIADSCGNGMRVQNGSQAYCVFSRIVANGYQAIWAVQGASATITGSVVAGCQDNAPLVFVADGSNVDAPLSTFCGSGSGLIDVVAYSAAHLDAGTLSFSRNSTGFTDGYGNSDQFYMVAAEQTCKVSVARSCLSHGYHGITARMGSSVVVDNAKLSGILQWSFTPNGGSCIAGSFLDLSTLSTPGGSTYSIGRLVDCETNATGLLYNSDFTGFLAGNTVFNGVNADQGGVVDLTNSTAVPDSLCVPDKNGATSNRGAWISQ